MKRAELLWCMAVMGSKARSEWLRIETMAPTRRSAEQKMLELYMEAYRDDPDNPASREGYDKFHEDRRAGTIRAVKVEANFEARR